MKSGLFGFLFAMWILILLGGGIMVTILGPFTIQQFGEFNWMIASGVKVTIALVLVIAWILILLKLKNRIFRKELKF